MQSYSFYFKIEKNQLKCLCNYGICYTFAPNKIKMQEFMLNKNAYFYGFYFYFTETCGAEDRM